MKVHRSALKHGVSPEDAIRAAEWSLWIEPLDDDLVPRRALRLRFDTGARLPETVVLVLESADEMVIHAMPARKQYLDLLRW
ncbi:MAG: toxin [Cellulomonas sp.]|uniref:toxin n=1 Tax=Cellulomonas sp. TaxID=40001 RepID=UPI0017B50815|nr:toxin [Cellulomonas sp.]NMM30986.1 toxin [Cellulomonas sp.]